MPGDLDSRLCRRSPGLEVLLFLISRRALLFSPCQSAQSVRGLPKCAGQLCGSVFICTKRGITVPVANRDCQKYERSGRETRLADLRKTLRALAALRLLSEGAGDP
jgi:hypothetical protein